MAGLSTMARTSLPFHAATHLLAAAVGYAVFTMVPVDGGKHRAAENGRPAMKVARERGKAEHAGETEAERLRRGEALLVKLWEEAEARLPPAPPFGGNPEEKALVTLADRTPPVADPAEEVRKLMGTAEADMTVEIRDLIGMHCLHWLRKDPAVAIAFLSDRDNIKANSILGRLMIGKAIAALVMERGWREVIVHFPDRDRDSIMKDTLLHALRRETGGAPLTGPAGQAAMEDFFRLAVDAGATEALDVLLSLGPDGVRWLDRKVAAGALPAGMLERLEQDTDYLVMVSRTAGIPLERRLRGMGDQPDERTEAERSGDLMEHDIDTLLSGARDWHYAFCHGGVTADEILEQVMKASPELAEKYPEELRRSLFKKLIPMNPQEAMRLLEHLPEEQRWRVALEDGVLHSRVEYPEALLSYMQGIPDHAAAGLLKLRSERWEMAAGRFVSFFPDEVVSWLVELPAGRERDLAAFHVLALRSELGTGSGARQLDRLAASIRDHQVLELMKAEGGGE